MKRLRLGVEVRVGIDYTRSRCSKVAQKVPYAKTMHSVLFVYVYREDWETPVLGPSRYLPGTVPLLWVCWVSGTTVYKCKTTRTFRSLCFNNYGGATRLVNHLDGSRVWRTGLWQMKFGAVRACVCVCCFVPCWRAGSFGRNEHSLWWACAWMTEVVKLVF